jgi:CYTH domain-containing protein/thymidylate kinase
LLKVCLTGGPCGGKTSSIAKINWDLTQKGYKVFTIPETATELATNGIAPSTHIDNYDFQKMIFALQKQKEEIYAQAASFYNPDKVVIICDRGYLDALAYTPKDKFLEIAAEYGMDEAKLMSSYDGVIHLTTAAKGTDHYTRANNQARRENAEEAIEADNKTLEAWIGHPHLRVIDNSTNFDDKVKKVLEEIYLMLGEPAPIEVERKYLIEKPSEEVLNSIPFSSKTDIIQTYLLSSDENVERRIRQRGTKADGFSFYYTEKTYLSPGRRVETERKINRRQYTDLLADADTSKHQVRKTRYCFLYENQYFELDLYPQTSDNAIVEIELKSLEDEVKFPPFLKVIKEVTDNSAYSNYAIAGSDFPKET